MERHSDHWLDLAKVNLHTAVIVSHISRFQLFIALGSSMDLVKLLNLLICLPDGGKAGSLSSHNIDSNTEISTQISYARTYKLHYFILHITICKYFTNDSKSNVLRSYARTWASFQINSNNSWHINIICLGKKLLHKLRSPLSHSHSSKSAITGMAV